MYTFLLLLTTTCVATGSIITLRCLRRVSMSIWKCHRWFQLLVLAMPTLLLSTNIGGVHSLILRICPPEIATWSEMIFPLTLCAIALGALGWGSLRLAIMAWWLKQHQAMIDPKLQAIVDTLAQRYALPSVPIWLTCSSSPLALTTGIRRPKIVLSTWMTQHLDQREIEAVLVHELEHVVRRDYLFNWITLMLRDAFFYLPTSRKMYRQIQQEKELICDQQVVQRTRRPLALASALTKVWLQTVEHKEIHLGQSLTGRHAEIQNRVERLIYLSRVAKGEAGQMDQKGQKEANVLRKSFCLQGITILLMMILMECIPVFLVNRIV